MPLNIFLFWLLFLMVMHRQYLVRLSVKDEGIVANLQCKKHYYFLHSQLIIYYRILILNFQNQKEITTSKRIDREEMPSVGIEPTTTWLKATRSTTELRRLCFSYYFMNWIALLFVCWMNWIALINPLPVSMITHK